MSGRGARPRRSRQYPAHCHPDAHRTRRLRARARARAQSTARAGAAAELTDLTTSPPRGGRRRPPAQPGEGEDHEGCIQNDTKTKSCTDRSGRCPRGDARRVGVDARDRARRSNGARKAAQTRRKRREEILGGQRCRLKANDEAGDHLGGKVKPASLKQSCREIGTGGGPRACVQ